MLNSSPSLVRSISSERSIDDSRSKWVLDRDTEASALGSHFAYAIAAIATGNQSLLLNSSTSPMATGRNSPSKKPFRQIFYEEAHYNPSLSQAHIGSAFDAHVVEESSHWSSKGMSFPHEPRKFTYPKDQGPTKPVEFPYVFEKPLKAYERQGEVRPYSRVCKISSNAKENTVSSAMKSHI